jgi:hypothetical protein
MKNKTLLVVALLSTINLQLSTAFAQGTAFTYQGRLSFNGAPANGIYDFDFVLYDAGTGGSFVGSPFFSPAVPVTNGLFTVWLDFGANFPGTGRWLEIAVRTNSGAVYTFLAPRQPVTPTPYAIMANSASNLLNTLPATQLSGAYSNA